MKFAVSHTTTYQYKGIVRESFNEARLQPFDGEGQDLHSFALTVGEESAVRTYKDFYGNRVHSIEIASPHETLEITADSIVETTHGSDGSLNKLQKASEVLVADIESLPGLEQQYDFVMQTPYTQASGAIWRFAMDCMNEQPALGAFAQELSARVYRYFTYVKGETEVETAAQEAFVKKQGVCQDCAHVFIAAARSLKVPTRYVSGYLYVGESTVSTVEHQSSLASHAWVEVYLPDVGWAGIDPTNNRIVNGHYIVLARGRDYADARPLSGTYRGAGLEEMKVKVVIDRVDS